MANKGEGMEEQRLEKRDAQTVRKKEISDE